jgi:hypothetical protein
MWIKASNVNLRKDVLTPYYYYYFILQAGC